MARAKPQPLSNMEILKRLHAFGYFGSRSWSDARQVSGAELTQALKHYQEFHGLKPDGVVGPRTASVFQRQRCGLPDFNINDGTVCKWPHKNITYYTSINLPGLTESQVDQAFDTAFAQWAAVCNIEPMRVEAATKANIYSRSGVGKKHHLDDRGGTLAWSELPCGVESNMQLDQMYDEAEAWSYNMAIAVMCHEIGHALGLPHLANGNLMAPYYDPNVTAPQKGDIKEIVALYGKRRKKTPRARAALLEVAGTIMINDRPYVLVPKT
jgi:hypothetical protein